MKMFDILQNIIMIYDDDERKENDTLEILEIEWKEPQNLNCPSLNSWRVHSWMVTASNNRTEPNITSWNREKYFRDEIIDVEHSCSWLQSVSTHRARWETPDDAPVSRASASARGRDDGREDEAEDGPATESSDGLGSPEEPRPAR